MKWGKKEKTLMRNHELCLGDLGSCCKKIDWMVREWHSRHHQHRHHHHHHCHNVCEQRITMQPPVLLNLPLLKNGGLITRGLCKRREGLMSVISCGATETRWECCYPHSRQEGGISGENISVYPQIISDNLLLHQVDTSEVIICEKVSESFRKNSEDFVNFFTCM